MFWDSKPHAASDPHPEPGSVGAHYHPPAAVTIHLPTYTMLSGTESSASRVLKIPEILSIILSYCYDGWGICRSELNPRPVNTLWCQEATKAAFQSCDDWKFRFLETLVDEGEQDYRPLVTCGVFLYSETLTTCLAKANTINLPNLTSLHVANPFDEDNSHLTVLFSKSKLKHISLKLATDNLFQWLSKLIQIFPGATYDLHFEFTSSNAHDNIFKIVCENELATFILSCFLDVGRVLPKPAHDLLELYPDICSVITHFTLEITAPQFIDMAPQVSSLFNLLIPTLKSIRLEIRNIFCETHIDVLEFVTEYTTPVVKRFENVTSLSVALGEEFDFQFDSVAGGVYIDKIRSEWAPQVVKHTPKLKSFHLEFFSLGGPEFEQLEFEEEFY